MSGNDYQKMAGAFLNIWQEQLSKSMTDGDFIRQMTNMMRQFQTGAKAGHDETHRNSAYASHAQSDELAHLQQRLAACERRIKQLEAWINTTKSEPEPESIPVPVSKPKPKPQAKPKPKSTKTSRRDEPERSERPAAKGRAKADPPAPAKLAATNRKVLKRAIKRK